MDYKHTCDTIDAHFKGIADNIYGFQRLFIFGSTVFLPFHPYFYPSTTGITCLNDGWTGLCIKLCQSILVLAVLYSPGGCNKVILGQLNEPLTLLLASYNVVFIYLGATE